VLRSASFPNIACSGLTVGWTSVKSNKVLLVALIGLIPAQSLAAELYGMGPLSSSTLLINSETYIRYRHTDEKLENFEDRNILSYVEQVERLNFNLTKNGLSLGVQMDQVALFANRYILDDLLVHERDLYDSSISSPMPDALIMLEKIYLQQRYNNVSFTLGDGYASFGRGVALNMVRNASIDIDTSIRGAQVAVSSGNMDFMIVSGLSNRQQINRLNINIDLDRDIPHMVTGAQIRHYALGPVQAGLHGVITRFGRSQDADLPGVFRYEEELDAVIGGATLEAFGVAGMDLYLEGDVFHYRTPEMAGQDEPLTGGLIYGSASFYPGPAIVLVEAKRSRDTERINSFLGADGWEISAPPTLEYERVITEDTSAAVNSNDLLGGRVRVDVPMADGEFLPYVSLASFRDEDIGGLHFNRSPETIYHPIVGTQWLPSEQVLLLNAGYRIDDRDDVSEGADQLLHTDIEFSTPMFGEESIEIAVSMMRNLWGDNLQGQEDFLTMQNAIVWKHGEKLDILIYQDWSNNDLLPSTGNITDELYGALEVQYKPNTQSEFSAFIGAFMAGIRCSGGQCRTLFGFEGAQMTYTTQF
jgi:hypothetical protein